MNAQTNHSVAVLENTSLKMIITDQGMITSLYNKITHTEFIATSKPTGWKLITSLGEWNEHPIFDHANTGELIQTGNQVELNFQGLTGCQNDLLAILLTLIFKIKDCSDEIELQAKIINNSDETIREIFFPYISGFTTIDNTLPDALALPLEMGVLMDQPLWHLPIAGNFGVKPRPGGNFFAMEFWPHYPLPYPGVACMPWLDFFNHQQGLYLGYHDQKTPTTAILARRSHEEPTFQLGFSRYPFVRTGETVEIGSYILKFHGGDWHEGAKCYQEFAKTKIKNMNAPEWIEDIPGVHFAFHISQNRHIISPYDELLTKFRHNQKMGLNLPLFVFGWVKTGFDNGYPEYEPDPRLGGKEKLKQIIHTITQDGGNVILYTQGRLIDKRTDYYQQTGQKLCLKNEYGTEYIDEYSFNTEGTIYPGKIFALACPATEGWYEQLKKQIDIVMDLGASGILFDQIAGDPPFLCFDQEHPHAKPDMAFDAKIGLLHRLQQYAESKDPQFVIMSELICDVYLQCTDLTHGMATFREAKQPIRYLPEMYKYVFPKHRITSRNANTINAYHQVLAMGFIIEYRDNLPQLNYLGSLLKMRTRLARFFVRGTFVDTDFVSYQPELLLIKVFLADNHSEKALIVVNETTEVVTAKISLTRTTTEWQLIGPQNKDYITIRTPLDQDLQFEVKPTGLLVVIVK